MYKKLNLAYIQLLYYLDQNLYLIFSLIVIAICAYGFELFNFTLTIDEEVHATYSSAVRAWIAQGRWGMYMLNRLLLPHTIIPFVPLFLALLFHISSIPLLMESWEITAHSDRVIAGAIGITFPIVAYMYTFSTINYGIGFGFFCIALSLFMYAKLNNRLKFLAIFPAAFAIGIYQGFLPALMTGYLIYLIRTWLLSRTITRVELGRIFSIHILAIIVYEFTQKLLLFLSGIKETSYISDYIDIRSLSSELGSILTRIIKTMHMVYSGDPSIYATRIPLLTLLISSLLIGLVLLILNSGLSLGVKSFLIFSGVGLLFLPFASGLALRGYLSMRFLVALPIAMMGIFVLGSNLELPGYQILIRSISVICIFQFLVSTNYLFGSSYLALQADRLMAAQLIERIEATNTSNSSSPIKYLDVVGYYSRQATPLIPKSETFGASFFEWEQGNPNRIVLFFRTIGYDKLQAAPIKKRVQMLEYGQTMPVWPDKGSVKAVDDVVIIKFGAYSYVQKQQICAYVQTQNVSLKQGFCK